MKRKLFATMLAGAMAASMITGCGSSDKGGETEAPKTEAAGDTTTAAEGGEDAGDAGAAGGGQLIGVAMPTKDLQRWNQDGSNMKAELEAAGYQVDLQYASNDVQTQVSQVENMISNGCELLVIASIDGSSLG